MLEKVLNALGGLFIIEMKYLKMVVTNIISGSDLCPR